MTSLPNRQLFEQELAKAVSRVRRDSGSAALLFLDVDDFKKVNDSFGHEIGDRVLTMIAARLRETPRRRTVRGAPPPAAQAAKSSATVQESGPPVAWSSRSIASR